VPFNVNFSLPNVVVPDEVVFGVAFDTSLYGSSPVGTPGPYDLLNLGLFTPDLTIPDAAGTDIDPDSLFLNSAFSSVYWPTDPDQGAGFFRLDTHWTFPIDPNNPDAGTYGATPLIRFEAADAEVPEPASLAVFGAIGLTALGLRRRTRN
jgi:hypothetical protein